MTRNGRRKPTLTKEVADPSDSPPSETSPVFKTEFAGLSMEKSSDLNLSASGDDNQTILLDTTASPEKSNNDSPIEIEKEVTPPQSTGSLRMLDLNDSNDEELLSRSNNLMNDLGDQLSEKNEKSKEPEIDKDEPVVSNILNGEEDDDSLLEIVPVKPKKNPNELDEDVSVPAAVRLRPTIRSNSFCFFQPGR